MSLLKSEITEVAQNIYLIDNHVFSMAEWGSTYFINEDRKAIIDTGPANSMKTVLDGIKRLGVEPKHIDFIFLTHIHMDHAGGAGSITREIPQAQVVVHRNGARHLINPEKLVGSMMKYRGDAMAVYGEMLPVAAERITSVSGGEVFRLSDSQSLGMMDAPGHAPHELCIRETKSGSIFPGDAAGVYVRDYNILLPSTMPPNFNMEQTIATFENMIKLCPSRICFGHFGVGSNAQALLKTGINKLREWDKIVVEAIKEGRFDKVAEEMRAMRMAEIEPVKHKPALYRNLAGIGIDMSITGFLKYYQDNHKS